MKSVRKFLLDQGLIEAHTIPSNSGELQIECPNCHNESKKFFVNSQTGLSHCKHCNLSESWRRFTRRFEPPTAQEHALEKFVGVCHNALLEDVALLQYFSDRGISKESIISQRLGFCSTDSMYMPTEVDLELKLAYPDSGVWVLADRITIPYLQDGIILKVRGRAHPDRESKNKYLDLPGAKKLPYFPSTIDKELPVCLTEGEMDALLLRQHGIQAIGFPGSNSTDPEAVRQYPHLYIAFDADKAGIDGMNNLIKVLPEVRRIDLPDGFDTSDYINTFGIDSFEKLMNQSTLYILGKPQREDRFSTLLKDFVDWSFTNGETLGPKMSWAPRLEEAMSGLSPGLILMGAIANLGKSCLLTKLTYEAALENPDDMFVLLGLDGSWKEAMSRFISLHTGIDFEKIYAPSIRMKDPGEIEAYLAAVEDLHSIEKNVIVRDAVYGNSLRYLRQFFSSLRIKYPNKRIVVCVDSLAKITPEGIGDDSESLALNTSWKAYLAKELKYLTIKHEICLITPTDFRKLNGASPSNDSLKDSSELAYEANLILLGNSDFYTTSGQINKDAKLKWQHEDGNYYPIVQFTVSKNKITKFRGDIQYKFFTPNSDFQEIPKEEMINI